MRGTEWVLPEGVLVGGGVVFGGRGGDGATRLLSAIALPLVPVGCVLPFVQIFLELLFFRK